MNAALKQLREALDTLRCEDRDVSLLEIFVNNLEANGGDVLAACSEVKQHGGVLTAGPASDTLKTACVQLLHDFGHTIFEHRLEQLDRLQGFGDEQADESEPAFAALGLRSTAPESAVDADAVVDMLFTRKKPGRRDPVIDRFFNRKVQVKP